MKCPHCGRSFDSSPGLFDDAVLRRMSRRGQPITSALAAQKALRSQSKTRQQVGHVLFRFGPMTDHELIAKCTALFGPRPESSYRKRRSEMTDDGFVADSGVTRVEDGERRVVWGLTELGLNVFGAQQEEQ